MLRSLPVAYGIFRLATADEGSEFLGTVAGAADTMADASFEAAPVVDVDAEDNAATDELVEDANAAITGLSDEVKEERVENSELNSWWQKEQAEVERLQNHLEETKQNVAQLEAAKQELEGHIADLQNASEELDTQFAQFKEESDANLLAKDGQIESMNSDIEQLLGEHQMTVDAKDQDIEQTYAALAEAESKIRSQLETQEEMTKNLADVEAALAETSADAAEKSEHISGLQNQIAEAKDFYEGEVRDREAKIEGLNGENSELTNTLANRHAEIDHLKSEIDRLYSKAEQIPEMVSETIASIFDDFWNNYQAPAVAANAAVALPMPSADEFATRRRLFQAQM